MQCAAAREGWRSLILRGRSGNARLCNFPLHSAEHHNGSLENSQSGCADGQLPLQVRDIRTIEDTCAFAYIGVKTEAEVGCVHVSVGELRTQVVRYSVRTADARVSSSMELSTIYRPKWGGSAASVFNKEGQNSLRLSNRADRWQELCSSRENCLRGEILSFRPPLFGCADRAISEPLWLPNKEWSSTFIAHHLLEWGHCNCSIHCLPLRNGSDGTQL